MSKLTICIPTYNRCSTVCSQVESIIRSIKDKDIECIDVHIRDNASSDDTFNSLINISKENNFNISLSKNSTNLGLVGNILRMLEDVDTEFVWFVGDDDILEPGIFAVIINNLNLLNSFGGMFFNYKCIDFEHNIIKPQAFSQQYNYSNLLDMFRKHDAIMMFITSMIYKTKVIKESVDFSKPNNERITFPLYSSLYADIKYGVKVINEIYISDQISGISWKDSYVKVRLIGVPSEIFKLNLIGIRKSKIFFLIINYFWVNKKFLIGCILRIFLSESTIEKIILKIKKKRKSI